MKAKEDSDNKEAKDDNEKAEKHNDCRDVELSKKVIDIPSKSLLSSESKWGK